MSKEIQKQPETSLAAYHSLTTDKLRKEHLLIIAALEKLGKGNYEQIASLSKLDKTEVGRRLSDLVKKGIIYRPGTKSVLKSLCKGYDFCLTNPPKVDQPAKLKPLNKPIYSMPSLF